METTTHKSLQADRLLTKRQVLALVPYSSVHLYRLIKKGEFPKQCRCSANRVAWCSKEVNEWIEAKKGARTQAAIAGEDV